MVQKPAVGFVFEYTLNLWTLSRGQLVLSEWNGVPTRSNTRQQVQC